MSWIDILLLALIGLILVLALRKVIRSRGSCSCGGSCSNCSGNCTGCGADCPHRKKERNE